MIESVKSCIEYAGILQCEVRDLHPSFEDPKALIDKIHEFIERIRPFTGVRDLGHYSFLGDKKELKEKIFSLGRMCQKHKPIIQDPTLNKFFKKYMPDQEKSALFFQENLKAMKEFRAEFKRCKEDRSSFFKGKIYESVFRDKVYEFIDGIECFPIANRPEQKWRDEILGLEKVCKKKS